MINYTVDLMGCTQGKYRFKRSTARLDQLQSSAQDTQDDAEELLLAWRELESTAERQITFDFLSCIHGANTGSTLTNFESTNDSRSPSEHGGTVGISRQLTPVPTVDGYSKFVSSVIGSLTRSSEACHILQEAILSQSRHVDFHS